MKYDSPLLKYTLRLGCCIALAVLLGACGGAVKKQAQGKVAEQIQMLPSKGYLPVRQYDKEGNVLPFVAMVNPYLEMKGRIEKEVVMDFIAARKAFKSQHFDEAETLLQRVIQNDKNLAGPWVMLGRIAIERGDENGAINHFEKAISVNKLSVNAYIPLAKLQRQQGAYIKAQNTYIKALAVWRDFPEAHLNLGVLYDIYLNDPLQAQQHMEAYQFLSAEKDKKVAKWLEEIRSRTGIAPNLYIGPSNTSQNSKGVGDKSAT